MKKAITYVVAFLHYKEVIMLCTICRKTIEGDIHNAMPITSDVCCSQCNHQVVIPFRFYALGTNSKEALVIDPNFKLDIVKPNANKFTLDELQQLVDGYIEYYPSRNKKYKIIVNEEGHLLRLSQNELSKQMFGIHAVGNVLIVPTKLLE
jgi:hypothetical protein